MTDSDDHGTASWRYWQKIRNDAGARGSYRDRPPVRVRARVVFERDGEKWVDGTATRIGFDGAIFVELTAAGARLSVYGCRRQMGGGCPYIYS